MNFSKMRGVAALAWLFRARFSPVPPRLRPRRPRSREVFADNDFQLTGLSVSKAGRFFVGYRRWADRYLNAVVEVTPNGQTKAFPNVARNASLSALLQLDLNRRGLVTDLSFEQIERLKHESLDVIETYLESQFLAPSCG